MTEEECTKTAFNKWCAGYFSSDIKDCDQWLEDAFRAGINYMNRIEEQAHVLISDCFDEECGPILCEKCARPAAWLIYNKKIKQDQELCKEHVPAEGTPRMLNYRKIQKNRCWREL